MSLILSSLLDLEAYGVQPLVRKSLYLSLRKSNFKTSFFRYATKWIETYLKLAFNHLLIKTEKEIGALYILDNISCMCL